VLDQRGQLPKAALGFAGSPGAISNHDPVHCSSLRVTVRSLTDLEHEYCGALASAVEEASLGRYTPDFSALELPRLETFGMKTVCF
jgi:hypothetical protein